VKIIFILRFIFANLANISTAKIPTIKVYSMSNILDFCTKGLTKVIYLAIKNETKYGIKKESKQDCKKERSSS